MIICVPLPWSVTVNFCFNLVPSCGAPYALPYIYKPRQNMFALKEWFLFILGVLSSRWHVTYKQMQICAAAGSSVHMSCEYTYPRRLTVKEAFWVKADSQTSNLMANPDYNRRATADCGNVQEGRCTLTLQGLKKGDDVTYLCRITTHTAGQRWVGHPGVTLKIAGNLVILWSAVESPASESKHPTTYLFHSHIHELILSRELLSQVDGLIRPPVLL